MSLEGLLAAAEVEPAGRWTFDVDRPGPAAARGHARPHRRAVPGGRGRRCRRTQAQVVRAVVDSLALAQRDAVRDLERLTSTHVDTVHVVGGGSRNTLLCQATADLCGVPVVAGPVEATALGNVLVQARALGVDLPDLSRMRQLGREAHPPTRYEPVG